MSAIATKTSRKMKKYAVLTREPRCFLGSFDFSWEQRKLGELVDVCSGRDYKHLSEGTIPVYGTGGYMLSVNDALSYDRDAIGIGRKGTIDRPYILKAPFWTVDTLFYAIPREKVDLNFAFDIFQNIDWKKKDESTGVPSLSKTAINDIDVLAPKHGEQQTIGQFFDAIDNLITLHQRERISFSGRASRLIPPINKKRITSSWEQRKLGDMMSVTSVKRIHQSDWTDSGVRFLRARDIVAATKNEEPDDYLYISKEKYEEYSALSGKVGVSDLLVTGVGTIGVPYLVRNLEPLYFKDGNIIWFQNSGKIDGKFLFYSFSAEQIQGFINESAGIGTVGTYTIESGKKTPILLPNQIEQTKVGEFFQQLDNLITLHQRKFEKLTNVKKSMLEKMFPQNGSSYPEIRFKGFTDPWEQRKLSYFLEVSTEKNTDNLYTKNDVLSVSGDFGIVNQIEFQGRSFAGASVSNYGVVHTGDVVYTKSPLKANPYGIIKANKGKAGIVSVLYGVYNTKENANADFIQMYFEQDARLNNYLRPLVNKGAKNTLLISDTDALEGEVCLAPTFDEQKAIGHFFDTLDNLITLHQRELEKLQNIKKSMLEKMFV